MSARERERSYLVRQVVDGRLSQRDASERLGVCVRQVKRLVARWRLSGDAGLVSQQRGRVSVLDKFLPHQHIGTPLVHPGIAHVFIE